jgi:hypothetical protein
MKLSLPEKLSRWFQARPLTRPRILLAFTVAVCADGLQLLLGPLGWAFADQIIDAVAMMLTMRIIGFHLLLLPAFVVELIPVVEDLPTWTACVAAVIALRKRGQPAAPKSTTMDV